MAPQHEHLPPQQHGVGGSAAEILDLDAEVLAEHTAAITAWLPLPTAPRTIVDLGAGTGTGTFALLDRFPGARVTAVDSSAEHLRHLEHAAAARHVSDQVTTVQADLDAATWPDLGRADLVWASASMHHLADPQHSLSRVHDLLAPDGLFAVVELAGFPRFLPDGAPEGRPGLEERCHTASDRFHAEHVPHRGADWGPKLVAAGFTVEDTRTITVALEGSRLESVGRYALATLQRMRSTAEGTLASEDLAALDELLDTNSPRCIRHRTDLVVRTERTVWAARRPR